MHVKRKLCFQLAVLYIMAQMGEKHPFGPYFRCKGGSLSHTEVGGMGSIAQASQYQGIDPLKVWQAFGRDATAISGVDERTNAKCQNTPASMADWYGNDFKARNTNHCIWFQLVQLEVRYPTRLIIGLQHIAKAGGDGRGNLLRAVDWQRTLLAEDPKVIDTVEMVCMVMGIEYGIKVLYVCSQSLQAKLGSGIDKQGMLPIFDEDAAAIPVVMRIEGVTYRAGTPDDRDPMACPCTEESYVERLHFTFSVTV